MNEFNHIRIIVGFILSLSIAQLLRGVAKMIVHPTKKRPYWVHLLWVAYIFLNLIYFWWWEYRLSQLATWTFIAYALVIAYILLFYLCCYLLVPDELGEYTDYKAYYFARIHWFFTLLCLTFILDIADTVLKGSAYTESLGIGYPVQSAIQIGFCLIAIRTQNERYHAALAIASIVYTVIWISRHYLIA